MQLHELACSSMSLYAVSWACMQFHELASSSMSFHAVPWACMQFHELACSSLSLHAIPRAWMQFLSLSEQLIRISQCLFVWHSVHKSWFQSWFQNTSWKLFIFIFSAPFGQNWKKFQCPSEKEFPKLFRAPLTFDPCVTEKGVITNQRSNFGRRVLLW